MNTSWRKRLLRLALVAIPAVAIGVTALIVSLQLGGGKPASATQGASYTGHFSVAGCTSNCSVTPSSNFTVDINLDTWPNPYDGISMDVMSTTGPCVSASTAAMAASWAGRFELSGCITSNEGEAGASKGVTDQSTSQKNKIGEVVFTCNSSGTVSLDSTTFIVNAVTGNSDPATFGSLSISCGGGGATDTPTNTPTNTNTPGQTTPTATRTATRTSTPTATHGPCARLGDVNGDGMTNSLDASFILQFEAHLTTHLPLPECADVNRDGHTNSLDALLVLQIDAHLIPQP